MSTRRRLVACVVLVVLCRVAQGLFAHRPSWFFPAYRTLSKVWAGALALLCSLVPFTIWDMGILALVVLALVVLVRRLRAHEPLLPLLSWVLLGASCTYAAFTLGWALNHYAPPLSGELGLEVRTYDTGELADATRAYLERAAQLAPQVPRDDDGALERQGFYELARIAGRSYEGLGERWPLLAGPNVPVKALLVWGYPLLYSGHTGIYWAATGEAGVPLDCAVADQPYIMCHEAAHRLGIASEQEANFCAYLACEASDDVRFAYSGYYNAFAYCFNALLAVGVGKLRPRIRPAAPVGARHPLVRRSPLIGTPRPSARPLRGLLPRGQPRSNTRVGLRREKGRKRETLRSSGAYAMFSKVQPCWFQA